MPHTFAITPIYGGLLGLLLVALTFAVIRDRKSTRLNSSHNPASRMPSSA
jgi:uncharacterized membrane protein YecN with MAPEG domain